MSKKNKMSKNNKDINLIKLEDIKEELKQEDIKEELKEKSLKNENKSENSRRLFEIILFQGIISIIGLLIISAFSISIVPSIIFVIISVIFILSNIKKRKEIEEIKKVSLDDRIHLKLLYGTHIVLFLHIENNISSIIAKKHIHSLTECVRLDNREIAYKIDTTKPSLIWGNTRIYIIDCESSQQISLNSTEKIINIHTIYDFCYKEALYKMTKSVHKGNLQNLSILVGFVMGFGLMGMILLFLINFGVL